MRRKHSGDRERAIELLKTTTLKYKEIEEATNVPYGTIANLGMKYRSIEVRRANRRRAGTENLKATHEKREEQSGGNRMHVQNREQESMPEEVITPSKGLSRVMIFSYEAKTDSPISKEEAVLEIVQLQNMIQSATGDQFKFSVSLEAKEGA